MFIVVKNIEVHPQGRVKQVQFGEKDQCSGLMVKKVKRYRSPRPGQGEGSPVR